MIGFYREYSELIMLTAYPQYLDYRNNTLVIGFPFYVENYSNANYSRIRTYNRVGDEFVFSDMFIGTNYAGSFIVLNNTATVLGVYDGTPKITIYDRVGSSWVSRAATLATTSAIEDFSMSADGKKIVTLRGQTVYTYTELNGVWTLASQVPSITISWWGCITLSNNGLHLYVGDSYKNAPTNREGIVTHYEWNGTSWVSSHVWQATTPATYGYFGRYIKLSDDNSKILIGNCNSLNTQQEYDLIAYRTLANERKFNVRYNTKPFYFCDDDWVGIDGTFVSLYRATDRYISGVVTQAGVPCSRTLLMTPPDNTTPILRTTSSDSTTGQFTIPVFTQTDVGLIIRSSNKTVDNDIIHKITPAVE